MLLRIDFNPMLPSWQENALRYIERQQSKISLPPHKLLHYLYKVFHIYVYPIIDHTYNKIVMFMRAEN